MKFLLPNRPTSVRLLCGPFRGARVTMNPRHSLRKIFGIYEHELNPWLAASLPRVKRVIDVGANDGYFMFGCAAFFRRRRQAVQIIGLEPEPESTCLLQESLRLQRDPSIQFELIPRFAGGRCSENTVTLDSLAVTEKANTLIKIDVEGAELAVIYGAESWLNASNLFLIEVHDPKFLPRLQETFSRKAMRLTLIQQRPIPLLGREQRQVDNCWLVSSLQN